MHTNTNLQSSIDPILIPQLDHILELHIADLNKRLYALQCKQASRPSAGFYSSAFIVQNAECKKDNIRIFLSDISKQIMSVLIDKNENISNGVSYFNDYSIKLINHAFNEALNPKRECGQSPLSSESIRIYQDAQTKTMEWREYYGQQLSVGYVDGVAWQSIPKFMQVAQIQHIHGNVYNVHISGGERQQFNMSASAGTQYNNVEASRE